MSDEMQASASHISRAQHSTFYNFSTRVWPLHAILDSRQLQAPQDGKGKQANRSAGHTIAACILEAVDLLGTGTAQSKADRLLLCPDAQPFERHSGSFPEALPARAMLVMQVLQASPSWLVRLPTNDIFPQSRQLQCLLH